MSPTMGRARLGPSAGSRSSPLRQLPFFFRSKLSFRFQSYREQTVSRGNEYGRSRWTQAKLQKGEFSNLELKPMNIVRYQRYPQMDLSAVSDRITNMRAEMDRVYNSTFGSSFRSPASLSPCKTALDLYQGKYSFIIHPAPPGLQEA